MSAAVFVASTLIDLPRNDGSPETQTERVRTPHIIFQNDTGSILDIDPTAPGLQPLLPDTSRSQPPEIVGDFLGGLLLFDGNFTLVRPNLPPARYKFDFDEDDFNPQFFIGKNDFAELNGKIYFSGRADTSPDEAEGNEIYTFTSDGQIKLLDIDPTTARLDTILPGSESSAPRGMVEFNGNIYFSAIAPQFNERVLFRIDQNSNVILVDADPDTSGIQPVGTFFGMAKSPSYEPDHVINGIEYAGNYYFTGLQGFGLPTLYQIEPDGSVTQVDANPEIVGFQQTPGIANTSFVEFAGAAYFAAGSQIFRIDENGVVSEITIDPSTGLTSDSITGIETITVTDKFLAVGMIARTGMAEGPDILLIYPDGRQVMASVGDALPEEFPNTILRGNIVPMDTAVGLSDAVYYRSSGGLFGEGVELWRLTSDGLVSQVDVDPSRPGIQTIYPGPTSSGPRIFAEVEGTGYFYAESISENQELWRIDPNGSVEHVDFNQNLEGIQTFAPGPNIGTQPFVTFADQTLSDDIEYWGKFNEELYFVPTLVPFGQDDRQEQVWKIGSDGIPRQVDFDIEEQGVQGIETSFSSAFFEQFQVTQNISSIHENPPDGGTDQRDVFRFFNEETNVHFYTPNQAEKDQVIATLPQFQFEGASFRAASPNDPNAEEVFRFFNEDTSVHFYTISEAERDGILASLPNFDFEGIGYLAYETQVEGSIPLYRFFNPDTGAHFYTPSQEERDSVLSSLPQFQSEGVGFYVDPIV
ncbi:MAG: hypothetical protein GVY09_13215 [Gammaproteobacteria bacterium]|jgi:hypothetical protein|nr:hypothetical protein [Gammaproteobacteria bacterium]